MPFSQAAVSLHPGNLFYNPLTCFWNSIISRKRDGSFNTAAACLAFFFSGLFFSFKTQHSLLELPAIKLHQSSREKRKQREAMYFSNSKYKQNSGLLCDFYFELAYPACAFMFLTAKAVDYSSTPFASSGLLYCFGWVFLMFHNLRIEGYCAKIRLLHYIKLPVLSYRGTGKSQSHCLQKKVQLCS